MDFQSLLFGRRTLTIKDINMMHEDGDLRSLVEAVDEAPPSLVPEILILLDELNGKRYLDQMLRYGFPERFSEILESGNENARREAIRLVVKFIDLQAGSVLLTERNTTHMVRMLSGSDHELRAWITYSLKDAIAIGHGWVISLEGGLEELIHQLMSTDPYLVGCTLNALDEMERVGFQQGMLKMGLMDRLRSLRSSEDPIVRSNADDLHLKLSVWIDSSCRLGDAMESDEVISIRGEDDGIDTIEEELGPVDGRNIGPRAKDRKKKGRRTIMTDTGSPLVPDNNTITDILLISTEPLIDR